MIGLAAALLCSGPVLAQVCSGGPDGGTDATGNQCNQLPDAVGYGVSLHADSLKPAANPLGAQRSKSVVVDVHPVAAKAAAETARVAREQGLHEYDVGHFATAARHLTHAAELGDPRSAEMLAFMYRYGEQLYGGGFRADQASARYWLSVAMALRHTDRSVATASSK